VKKYDSESELFKDIPPQIAKVLLHDFSDLMSEDFTTIIKYDPLTIPNGNPITLKDKQRDNVSTPQSDLDEDELDYLNKIQQEIFQNDIMDINNDKDILSKLPEIEKFDESDEEDDIIEDPNWKNRLRKRVTFKEK
jgi:hypothetical protein